MQGDPRTFVIIGAAMAVHRALSYGFSEAVYQAALARELEKRGISYTREVRLPIQYDGRPLDRYYRADFLCDEVVVELKAQAKLEDGQTGQVVNYLRATGFTIGLLINFGGPSLEYRRVISTHTRNNQPESAP